MSKENEDRNDEHEIPITDILNRRPAARPHVEIDVDYYQSVIDDPSVSEARKRELIAIIGRIVVQFIDIGFDVHPVQLAQADKTGRPNIINQAEKERPTEESAERIDA